MRINQILLPSTFAIFMLDACVYDKGIEDTVVVEACDTISITYNSGIDIIVNNDCAISGCHDAGSGSGDFSTYTGLKEKADGGQLENRVLKEKTMPPSGYPPLTDEELQLIDCWLKSGAAEN